MDLTVKEIFILGHYNNIILILLQSFSVAFHCLFTIITCHAKKGLMWKELGFYFNLLHTECFICVS